MLSALDGRNHRRTHDVPSKTLSEFTPYNETRVNVCMAIQNHCGAQTTQQFYGDGAGLTVQASFSHFLSPPAQRANSRPPKWAAYAKSRWSVFLHPRYLLPPSAQLLGFCLFSTLEIIVGLHEEKPGTLPIADRTCLL
jgi:hypothetical protein